MVFTAVQCPKCGAPIDNAQPGGLVKCPSCASILEVSKGTSGFPLASLVAIGQDTGFIAKRQAVEQLKGRLDQLVSARERAEGPSDPIFLPAWSAVVAWLGAIPALIGLISLVLDGGPGWLLPLALGLLAVTFGLERSAHSKRKSDAEQKRATLQPERDKLESEIRGIRLKIRALESDLEQLARDM